MLILKVLNSDAVLNSFIDIKTRKFTVGEDFDIVLQLFQEEKGIRYSAEAGATLELQLSKKDGTTLNKALTMAFTDDRSIWKASITAAEANDLISQTLKVQITEGSKVKFALKQSGLQKIIIGQDC